VRRAKVLSHATTSKPGYFVCPACGSGELLPRGSNLARCGSCGCAFDDAIVGTLKQIVALPDALGEHACEECDHPEMRHLPDGVFHCPACGSEVLPILLGTSTSLHHSFHE
jgi:ribosomal protein L37AE/L43A